MSRRKHISMANKDRNLTDLRLGLCICLFAVIGPLFSHLQAAEPLQEESGQLIFQTSRPWSPRTNINADTVMVYGTGDDVAGRIQSWRSHGYHVTLMTGVA